MAKTVTFWPWWQPFDSLCFETLSLFPLFPFILFAAKKVGGGACPPRPPRYRRSSIHFSFTANWPVIPFLIAYSIEHIFFCLVPLISHQNEGMLLKRQGHYLIWSFSLIRKVETGDINFKEFMSLRVTITTNNNVSVWIELSILEVIWSKFDVNTWVAKQKSLSFHCVSWN